MLLEHPWPAIFDAYSRVLILGSFPSPQSRRAGYPYGHPQNIFWSVLAAALSVSPVDRSAGWTERAAWLNVQHIALWDVLASCEIDGAADSSIRNPQPQLFRPLIQNSQIRIIFTTGRQATDLFQRLCAVEAGMEAHYLPSTSPANRARQQLPEFKQSWAEVGIWARD